MCLGCSEAGLGRDVRLVRSLGFGQSLFANRDFTELPDGEVRLTHPLNAHLAHTAALWRKACEPVADWLAGSFGGAVDSGAALSADSRMIRMPKQGMVSLLELVPSGRTIGTTTKHPRHRSRPSASCAAGRSGRKPDSSHVHGMRKDALFEAAQILFGDLRRSLPFGDHDARPGGRIPAVAARRPLHP
jgi:hypothetical protein